MTDEELQNLEDLVERHGEAVNEDAAQIEQLKREVALIIEALEMFNNFNANRERFRAIVKRLQANHQPEKKAR